MKDEMKTLNISCEVKHHAEMHNNNFASVVVKFQYKPEFRDSIINCDEGKGVIHVKVTLKANPMPTTFVLAIGNLSDFAIKELRENKTLTTSKIMKGEIEDEYYINMSFVAGFRVELLKNISLIVTNAIEKSLINIPTQCRSINLNGSNSTMPPTKTDVSENIISWIIVTGIITAIIGICMGWSAKYFWDRYYSG